MDTMEIVLLIAGVIIFILSFFIPDKKGADSGMSKALAEEEIKKLVNEEFAGIKGHVDEVVEEAVTYAIEKTERSLERLSNEKIMAVSEYSDTVLSEIHKNHEEAMFLYDMLNSKHVNIKNTVSEVNRTVKEAEEAVSGIRKFVPETVETTEGIGEKSADKAEEKLLEQPEKFAPLQATVRKAEISDGVAVDFVSPTPVGTPLTGEQLRNNNEKILELYKQGLPAVEIAKTLGLGVGEVGLVIGLYQNQ